MNRQQYNSKLDKLKAANTKEKINKPKKPSDSASPMISKLSKQAV